MAPGALPLFDSPLPSGFHHRPNFISADEERELAAAIQTIEFATFEMRGVIARRRVAFYGASYDETRTVIDTKIPAFLDGVRARAAEWAGIGFDDFAMALVNEYRPGAPIGWHRDAPQYGIIAGISLLSACRMRLRPYVSPQALAERRRTPRKTTHEIFLLPRSGYLITGEARSRYEHSIPAVDELRYSITFRTLRSSAARI
jgi:alkylated DNA repair dioxygenase AlkB